MLKRLLTVIFAIVAIAGFAQTAHAQYIYMDANGDGVWSTADRLNANGTPTVVSIYVNTSFNKNGTAAVCNGDGDLSLWNSFAANIIVTGGTVSFTAYTNNQPTFSAGCADAGGISFKTNLAGTEMTACQSTSTLEAAGLKKAFTVTVTGLTLTPSLSFQPFGSLTGNQTSFGTSCSTPLFDYTYKLGEDFLDNDGVGPFLAADQAPVVTAPATASGAEGTLITFTVTAVDPDGTAITSLTASALPAGATFTANATNTSGTFSWTPTLSQSGTYSVTFTATNALSGSATTVITVGNANQNPTVTAPATVSGNEGTLITFIVTASDPDGDVLTLTALGLPTGATFTANASGTSGTFSWTPDFTQAGTYSVTFRANDGNGGIANATTVITVNNVDRAPIANAGGPYTGITNVAVQFSGSGSSDPDGDALTYAWTFGDGGTGTGVSPTHTYTAPGTYTVILTVTANGVSTTDTTTATISNTFAANVFTVGGNKTTSLGAGKPYSCFQIEPVGGSYSNTDVILSSISMAYPVGSSNKILADASKTVIDGDKNGNGITEISACFTKASLRILFAGLPAGSNTVTVEITGNLITGGSFSGTVTFVVKSNGAFLAASISPNPLNPQAKLSFSTTKPGAIRVQMFDPQGRLVKTIADEASAVAGYHDFTIDGRSASGSKLASGVYFVKIWAEHDGQEVQRVTILK